MASAQNVIRTLTIRSKAEGAQETAAALKGVQTAYENVAKVTETSAKGQLSLADSVSKAERRFNSALRAQQDYEKVQRDMNRAIAQNPALQDRANIVIAQARQHFDRAAAANDNYRGALTRTTAAQSAFQAASSGSITSVAAVAVQFARTHPILLAFALAAGGVAAGLALAGKEANAFADRAGQLVDFAQSTGFTTTQLQLLNRVAAEVGVSQEQLGTSIEKFAVGWQELTKGTGDLRAGLLAIKPEFVDQLRTARNVAEAFSVYGQQLRTIEDAEKKIALNRKAMGRGGVPAGRVAESVGAVGGIDNLPQTNIQLKETLDRVDQLRDASTIAAKTWRDNFASMFSAGFLTMQKDVNEEMVEISATLRDKGWADASIQFLKLAFGVKTISDMFKDLKTSADAAKQSTEAAGSGPLKVTVYGGQGGPRQRTPQEIAAEDRERNVFLGEAATFAEKYGQALRDINSATAENAKLTGVAGRVREAADLALQQEIANAKVSLNIADEKGILDARLAAMRATAAKAGITDAEQLRQAEAKIKEGVRETIEGMRTKEQVAQANVDFERQIIFFADEERKIATELRAIYGDKGWKDQMNGKVAGHMREVELLKQIQDIASTSLSGFAKDIANGVKPLDALVNQAKRLQDIFIDMAAKRIVAEAMSGAFGGVTQAASQTGGAAASATVFTGAATSMVGIWLAGASAVYQILTGASAAEAAARVASASTAAGITKAAAVVEGVTKIETTTFAAQLWNFLTQNWMAMLIAAIAAIAAAVGLMGNSAENERQRKAIQGYRDRATLARTDTSTLPGALDEFDMRARSERAALPGGGVTAKSWTNTLTLGLFGDKGGKQTGESIALDQALAAERIRLIEDFGKRAVEAEKQAAADRLAVLEDFGRAFNEVKGLGFLNEAADLKKQITAYAAAGADYNQLLEFQVRSVQQIADDAKLTGEPFQQLLAVFPQLAGSIHEFVAVIEDAGRSIDEIASERQSLQDQLFGLTQNQSTLPGKLAVFELQALRAREDQIRRGGENLADLEALQFQQRLDIIKDFNNDVIAEQKRAAEESKQFFESLRRNLREFIDGLRGGAQSPLSPEARLTAARAAYNEQLALAQGGNRDALSGIQTYASNFIDADRAFYGAASTAFNQVIAQLEVLPDLAELRDPLVIAIEAAQTTNDALLNQLMDTNQDGVVSQVEKLAFIKSATEGTYSTAQTISSLQGTANSLQSTTNSLSDQIRDNIGTSNAILGEIRSLNDTSRSHLDLMKTQLTSNSALNIGNQPVNNTMLVALNKIVYNTFATANNTAQILFGIVAAQGNISAFGKQGVLHAGGWVTGQGEVQGTLLSNEYVLNRSQASIYGPMFEGGRMPAMPSFAGANDNGGLLAELRALRAEVAKLRQENSSGHDRMARVAVAGAEHVREGVDDLKEVQQEAVRDAKLAAA